MGREGKNLAIFLVAIVSLTHISQTDVKTHPTGCTLVFKAAISSMEISTQSDAKVLKDGYKSY